MTQHLSIADYTEADDLETLSDVISANEIGEFLEIIGGVEQLYLLISSLFRRRFAWSEHAFISGDAVAATLEDDFSDGEQEMRDLPSEELRLVCDSIDLVLETFSLKPLTIEMIDALEHCIVDSHSPVVRGQAFKYFFEWLRQPSNIDCSNSVFLRSKGLIVRGVTDMWSAIRRRCTGQLARIIGEWSMEKLETIWTELLLIASSKNNPWQAQEGAALLMTTIMRKFTWVSSSEIEVPSPKRLEFQGQEIGNYLPEFITHELKPALYSLLAHPQPSVRETASRAFSAFLSRSPFEDLLECFDEVVGLLRPQEREHDAYKCEGLLKFSVVLVKLIPVPYLLTRWSMWFDVFDRLLSHSASTVRQACSSVFKHVVGRDTTNARLFLLLLQSLAIGWSDTQSWEWKEGRLLTYELVLGLLVANHHHYVFPGQRDPRSPEPNKVHETTPGAHSSLRAQASVGTLSGPREPLGTTHANFSSTMATLANTPESPQRRSSITTKQRPKLSRSKSARDVKAKKEAHPIPVTVVEPARNGSPLDDRRGTIAGTSPTSMSLLMRRKLNVPSGMPRTNSLVAMSLVDQLKSLGKKIEPSPLHQPQPHTPPPLSRHVQFPDEPETPIQPPDILSPITPSFAHAHSDVEANPQWADNWWDSVDLRSSGDLLSDVLSKVSSCLLPGSRWELRRMVDQVMPLLIDTCILVNPDVLKEIWSVHDPLCDRQMVIIMTYSLKFALRRYSRLKRQLVRATTVSSWSEDAIMRALEVISLVETGCTAALPALISVARGYSDECNDDIHVTDRVRTTAAEVLVKICVLLPESSDSDLDPRSAVQAFAYALCTSPETDSDLPTMRPFKNAPATEKLLVPSLAPLLPAFLHSSSPGDVVGFAPVIRQWCHRFVEDAATQLHVVDCLRLVVECAKRLNEEGFSEGTEALRQAVDTLEALIVDKRVEQSVLSLTLRISMILASSETHVIAILKAIVRRLVLENVESFMYSGETFVVEPLTRYDGSLSLIDLDDVDEIGDEDKDDRMSEPAPAKDDDSGNDSDDWDDWDEDNDGTVESLTSEFGNLVRQLDENGQVTMSLAHAEKYELHEHKILTWLVKTAEKMV